MELDTIKEVLAHPLFSLAAGAGITWAVAWYYYKRAGDELRREARTLQAATRAIVYILEHPGADIRVQRDDNGNVKNLCVGAVGGAQMKFGASGTLTDGADT